MFLASVGLSLGLFYKNELLYTHANCALLLEVILIQ